MAMNRADYLKRGMEHYENMKKVDGPLTLESLEYLGNSWQAKAFRDGFAYAILDESRQQCGKVKPQGEDIHMGGDQDHVLSVQHMDGRVGMYKAERGKTRRGSSPSFGLGYNPRAAYDLNAPLALVATRVYPGRQVCADRARVLRRRGYAVRFSHKHARTGKAVYVWDMVKKN